MAGLAAVTVYLFKQTGCPACAQATKFADTFRKKHPGLIFIELNVAKKQWNILGYEPTATPAYLVTINRHRIFDHVGVLNEKQLEKLHGEIQKHLEVVG